MLLIIIYRRGLKDYIKDKVLRLESSLSILRELIRELIKINNK